MFLQSIWRLHFCYAHSALLCVWTCSKPQVLLLMHEIWTYTYNIVEDHCLFRVGSKISFKKNMNSIHNFWMAQHRPLFVHSLMNSTWLTRPSGRTYLAWHIFWNICFSRVLPSTPRKVGGGCWCWKPLRLIHEGNLQVGKLLFLESNVFCW